MVSPTCAQNPGFYPGFTSQRSGLLDDDPAAVARPRVTRDAVEALLGLMLAVDVVRDGERCAAIDRIKTIARQPKVLPPPPLTPAHLPG